MSALIGVNTVKCDFPYIYYFFLLHFVIIILKTKTNFANMVRKPNLNSVYSLEITPQSGIAISQVK